MKKTRGKKFKVRMFYHLQNLFWGVLSGGFLSGGLCPGGFCPGGICPVTIRYTVILKVPYDLIVLTILSFARTQNKNIWQREE